MISRMGQRGCLSLISVLLFTFTTTAFAETKFVQIAAKDKFQRSAIADLGISIEEIRSDSVWAFADEDSIKELQSKGFNILGTFDQKVARGGKENLFGFPTNDAKYHDYAETVAELRNLNMKHADITRLQSIGKSHENRDIWAIHINTNPDALQRGASGKPGVLFMGAHHAREHLTVEMALMLAQHLLDNRSNEQIARLLDTRDIWIIPMVNPDGAEYDISTGRYKMWRKNRRNNKDGNYGVDLNRNYGFKWGTGGSSNQTSSDVYMGPEPFSEPETRAIRDFVRERTNAKVLLTLHTYSELVLYPWGHSYDAIGNARDQAVFQTMARTMAGWNKYTPQQSSDLYIASGDTTDWAYGELGMFAFTFELSPKDAWGGGGFYPGAGMIDKAFQDNLRPFMYLIEVADDPYKVVQTSPSGWLKNYVQPKVVSALY